jgi:hypothetical protein
MCFDDPPQSNQAPPSEMGISRRATLMSTRAYKEALLFW